MFYDKKKIGKTTSFVHHFDNHPASTSMFEGTHLKCLLDSGSSGNVIGAENLPPHWQQWAIPNECTWTSGGGSFKTHFDGRLECSLPSFSSSRKDSYTRIILGRNYAGAHFAIVEQ